MSLATFKKKAINSLPSATKRSGIPCNNYWIYPGPFGLKDSVASVIAVNSVVGPDGKIPPKGNTASNSGFSINGVYRGGGGTPITFSKNHTPFKGPYPCGYGGTQGRFPISIQFNAQGIMSKVTALTYFIKPSVLSNTGMLARRFRWINSGQYPNYWVQPNYTGNLTDTSSQGNYISDKTAKSICVVDTNDAVKYANYYRRNGPFGCNNTSARGYTMGIQQSNAPYTKGLRIPMTASEQTTRIQRQCVYPTGPRKPFPYRVQTGTGILSGGTSTGPIGSSCFSTNTYLSAPEWYLSTKPTIEKGFSDAIQELINTEYVYYAT
jgi:hypothetical protein